MSTIFSKLKQHALDLENILSARCTATLSDSTSEWYTRNFRGSGIRRANLDIIDVSASKKLFMLHLCVFPDTNSSAPIYGFDIIAGPSKVTGAFLDFSPVSSQRHHLSTWFEALVTNTSWSKQRELPNWAKNIFSPNMLAAGNITDISELDKLLSLSKTSLLYYLDSKSLHSNSERNSNNPDFSEAQNYYCQQQKCNPHTARVLKSLGFSDEQVSSYIHNELFPEV